MAREARPWRRNNRCTPTGLAMISIPVRPASVQNLKNSSLMRWPVVGPVARCLLGLAAGVSPAVAAVITVPAGGNLQAAITAATEPGDAIQLQPAATFIGNFVLPAKPGRAVHHDSHRPRGDRAAGTGCADQSASRAAARNPAVRTAAGIRVPRRRAPLADHGGPAAGRGWQRRRRSARQWRHLRTPTTSSPRTSSSIALILPALRPDRSAALRSTAHHDDSQLLYRRHQGRRHRRPTRSPDGMGRGPT